MNARLAAECRDLKPGIVGERSKPEAFAAATAFSRALPVKARLGLIRLRQAELARRHDLDAVGRNEIGDLAHLALVVAGDDEARAGAQTRRHQATVSFCSCTSSAMPRRASSISASNCSWLKASCSAVPCTSTMPPEPVITKLASACAVESSA